MSQRFEGKNLEEALQNASQTFGVQRYQLTYHVLLEKRGFLGGMKRIVIEAEINEEAPATAPEPPQRSAPSATPRAERGRGRGGRGRRGERGDRRERGERRPRERRGAEYADSLPAAEYVPVEVPDQGEESEGAAGVRQWCERAIELAHLDLQVRTEENENQVIVRLYGRDGRRLIDGHGELIDALQVLANKALVGRRIEKEIELDCLEFKGRRSEEIAQRAREMADRVRRDRREQLLPAMTPIERRIVHLALQDDREVTTISRGEGFYKRVAILPRPAEESSERPAE